MTTCHEVDGRIEAVVAGDEPASDAFRAHLEGCLRCAAAVARARQVDESLRARPAPQAPANFSSVVLARIRRERWRSEQQVDRLFNAALAAGLVLIVAGVLALLNLTDVTSVMASGVQLFNDVGSRAVRNVVPAASMYLSAALFLVTALVVWWWAERRVSW
jgi:anti-sigma factor RsiW